MTAVSHTPGPWFATRDGGCDTLVRAGNCENGRRIATTFASQPPAARNKSDSDARKAYIQSCNRNQANARLIAAAPELLEALQAFQAAQAMSRFGEASDFIWPALVMRYPGEHAGGYLCPSHGLGYTSRCICCESDYEKHSAHSDSKARGARDDALKAANQSALAAIAKATGASA